MLTGFSPTGKPQLFLTDPAGIYSEWKAKSIGGSNEKAVNEFLEKNWAEDMEEAECLRTTVKALVEVVDSGAKNMEVAIMRRNEPVHMVKEDDLAKIIADIEKEVEEAKAKSAEKDNE